ncbi:hypothetical protein DMENIID0001_010610 [Sergentomyia squamirostris]
MSICGYTTSATISTINTEDIENMEQYMRDLDPTVAPPLRIYMAFIKIAPEIQVWAGRKSIHFENQKFCLCCTKAK